jgi:hypothetical protein
VGAELKQTSLKTKRESKKVRTKRLEVKIRAPLEPKALPENPANAALISGRYIINKYISFWRDLNPRHVS